MEKQQRTTQLSRSWEPRGKTLWRHIRTKFFLRDVRCGYIHQKQAGGTKTRSTGCQNHKKLYQCIENLKRSRI